MTWLLLDRVLSGPARTGKRLGISVKSRTRGTHREPESVDIFKKGNDRQKLIDACRAFACEPWIAVYVETAESAHLYLTSLDNFDRKYRSRLARSSDTPKMGKEDWKMSKRSI